MRRDSPPPPPRPAPGVRQAITPSQISGLDAANSAEDILSKLLTVDGAGSGLDADLLDAQHGAHYLDRANHTGTQDASTITGTLTVPQGGTGAATFTNNRLLTGNGTGALVDEANLTFNGTTLAVTGGLTVTSNFAGASVIASNVPTNFLTGTINAELTQSRLLFYNRAGAAHLAGNIEALSISIKSATTTIQLIDATGTRFSVHPTTASAANAFIDTGDNNYLKRSTSSIRYKRDMEPIAPDYADAILKLQPIWYRSKCDGDNPEWSWWGLSAEAVAKIDPRLVQWGYEPEDYFFRTRTRRVRIAKGMYEKQIERIPVLRKQAKLRPVGVDYARLSVLLLSLCQRRFADIDQRLTRLETAL